MQLQFVSVSGKSQLVITVGQIKHYPAIVLTVCKWPQFFHSQTHCVKSLDLGPLVGWSHNAELHLIFILVSFDASF
ncbi:hypothetical protein D2V08_01550 [Flagellimonas lutimaris]|uniref:Uncharacterized protein n=1 Tax=Flagellimonas lutimaris TaxID=475082 RepID=A0A3A1NE17_9FLAO|nr:hypothetical protein D2V08_01550 [Allomuricauda lutimaris]